jgi:hypothetical protein
MTLGQHPWLRFDADLAIEADQCRDEGIPADDLPARIEAILALPAEDPRRLERAGALLDETRARPVAADFPYDEPSDLEGIRARQPEGAGENLSIPADPDWLLDRIHGAWLGRCAGCLLGKPVEGWHRAPLGEFMRATGEYPPRAYLRGGHAAELIERFKINPEAAWIDRLDAMPEDDDINYTIVALDVLERYGPDFKPGDVMETWLHRLPLLHVCCDARVGYRNATMGLEPPETALWRNVYRECIGAQIRGDGFGYASPGRPARAAQWAWRDASISTVKNGIYGEMWAAAMAAAAFALEDPAQIVRAGLAQIPARSRLSAEVERVIDWRAEGIGWEEAFDRIHAQWDEKRFYHWVHTIPNAMIVTVALLWGERDLERTIGIAVAGALDTDCNGATSGSVVGAMRGARALPASWTAPLRDTIRSGVQGFDGASIADLARRTRAQALR